MAVAGHMTDLEAPDWSNKVLIDMSEVGSHLCWLQLQFDGVLFWNWGVFFDRWKHENASMITARFYLCIDTEVWTKVLTEDWKLPDTVCMNRWRGSLQLWSCCWMSRRFLKSAGGRRTAPTWPAAVVDVSERERAVTTRDASKPPQEKSTPRHDVPERQTQRSQPGCWHWNVLTFQCTWMQHQVSL